MSINCVKVLELVAIEKNHEKSYLRIKLLFGQELEFFFEIDNETAENLNSIIEFDGYHKYRLSLHTSFDTTKKQFKSLLTKTYRDVSKRIYFTCSVNFKNCLESIKNSQSTDDLYELPFLSMNLSVIGKKKNENEPEQNEVVFTKEYSLTFKRVRIAMISVAFVILIGYLYYYLNEIKTTSTVVTNAQVKIAEVNFEKEKNDHIADTKLSSIDDTTQLILPSIEIDEPLVYSIPKGYVALTFDDGPSKYTVAIADILKKYKVGGTFFFLGVNINKYPDSVRYIQSNGYSIGNHSMNHLYMPDFSTKRIEDELLQSTKAIEDITKEELVLFRPPYGALNEQIQSVIQNQQYKIVLWNNDPEDWRSRDQEKIIDYIHNSETSGSIILLHESQAVVDALPKIIENLQERDLKIVNLY